MESSDIINLLLTAVTGLLSVILSICLMVAKSYWRRFNLWKRQVEQDITCLFAGKDRRQVEERREVDGLDELSYDRRYHTERRGGDL